MISIVYLCKEKDWRITLSSKELPTNVLETAEGSFFAGFISASSRGETGPLNTGTSKYCKGVKAFQVYCVEKRYGKTEHLRAGGMDKLTARLSVMKGFTKEYWSIRGSIAALFKEIKPVQVTHLETYVRSKTEILKCIKTKLPYNNGGIFRPEEIAYLAGKYSNAKARLDQFVSALDEPTEDLAKNFKSAYAELKSTILDRIDNELKVIMTSRAKYLFPEGKGKKQTKFSKKSLDEKLMELPEEKVNLFKPESLPGINASGTSAREEGTLQWKKDTFSDLYSQNELVTAVIDSWYSTYFQQEE